MAEQNIPPAVLAKIDALRKDVYELKRRQLPAQPSTTTSGFPIIYDDGTYTYTIDIEGSPSDRIITRTAVDADPSITSVFEMVASTGYVHFQQTGGFEIDDLGGGIFLRAHDGGGLHFDDYDTGGTHFYDHAAGGLYLNDLPTSAPGGTKQVWNNGGVLNITP